MYEGNVLIQLFLSYRKLDKSIWGSATEEEKAVANLTRVTLEDHFAWFVKDRTSSASPFKLPISY
jgi:hypothetical protein